MPKHHNLNILIVDDDPIHLSLLRKRLSSFENINEACSFNQAKEILETKEIHLAFFDLDLDLRLEGLGLVEIAKKKKIYSVIVSSNKAEEIIKQGYTLGCFDYLSKPASTFDIDRILFKYQNFRQEKIYETPCYTTKEKFPAVVWHSLHSSHSPSCFPL